MAGHRRRRRTSQHCHLHQRRPRDDRQRAYLVPFSAVPTPQLRERAEADADQAFDSEGTVSAIPILRAVFEEALRLYPPAAMLARQAIADDELGGVRIPAGTVVTVSPYVLHSAKGPLGSP